MRHFNPRKIATARYIDFILRAFFPLFFAKNQDTDLSGKKFRKIIVFEFFFIGDVIMATPALKALRKRFPEAEITLLVPPSAQDIKRHLPWVDRTVTFHCPWSAHRYDFRLLMDTYRLIRQLRTGQWDLAVELRGDMRNILFAFLIKARRRVSFGLTGGDYFLTDIVPYDDTFLTHQLEGNLEVVRYIGGDISENLPELMNDPESALFSQNYLRDLKRPIIGVHPCASKTNRLWEDRKWVQLINRLVHEYKATVMIFYGTNENDQEMAMRIYQQIDLKDQCLLFSRSLSDLIALISQIDLLIALDSAASHIAAAVRTPFLTLFGPQTPELTRPYYFGGRVIIKSGFDCRPCGIQCTYGADNRCMKAIEVDDVLEQVEYLIGNGIRRKPYQGVDCYVQKTLS